MKVSLTQLERLKQNPAAFKATMNDKFTGRYSMFQALKHATFHYHKTRDCQEAKQHLRNLFSTHFRSPNAPSILLDYLAQLDEYVMRYEDRKFRCKKRQYNIALELPSHLSPNVDCTGQIPLLSFKASLSHWDALFYSQDNKFSTSELRLPLIQKQIANEMEANLNEVSVSFYNFKSGVFTPFQFDQSEVDAAQAELENLLAQII